MQAATHNGDSHFLDAVKNAFAWQFPPDADVSYATTPTLTSHDSCPDLSWHPSEDDMPHCAARRRADTWPGCAERDSHPQKEADSEVSKPFLSLLLPQWVHDKNEEDEAAGLVRCTSLASFSETPRNSDTGSLVSSCVSSPQLPSAYKSPLRPVRPRVRRSGVCWADLEESDEDKSPVTSPVSTAASSPIGSSSWAAYQIRHSGACWADLEESDDDNGPVTSPTSTTTSSPIARTISLQRDFSDENIEDHYASPQPLQVPKGNWAAAELVSVPIGTLSSDDFLIASIEHKFALSQIDHGQGFGAIFGISAPPRSASR